MENKELVALAKKGDREAMEMLIKGNEKLIWSIVHRFSGRGADLQDLFQIGSIGFLKAVEGYEEGYGTEFSTYAVPKIMGEIRRHFRDDGLRKVSRDIKSKAAAVRAAAEKLEKTLDRAVRVSDIAAETGMNEEEIAYVQAAADYAYSIDASANEDGLALKDTLGVDREDEIIDKLSVKNAIEQLPDKEKQVILLRFFKDLTQQKTADILGITQVQVSRTEKKAITLMRKALL